MSRRHDHEGVDATPNRRRARLVLLRRGACTVVAAALAAVMTPAVAAAGQRTDPAPVIVTLEGSGTELTGRLVRFDDASLAVAVGDELRMVPFDAVRRVEVRGDPVANGALIGAAVGGLWYGLVAGLSGPAPHPSSSLAILGTVVGLGATIGAGVDAMQPGRTTIYERPGQGARSGRRQPPRRALLFRWRF